MKPFLVTILTIALFVSCTKPDTAPNSPSITGKWLYTEQGVDENDDGSFQNEINYYSTRNLTLTFKSDGNGLYEGDVFIPVPFKWSISDKQFTIQWPDNVFIPDIPCSQFTIDSLTIHVMRLSNDYQGHARYFLFKK